MDTEVGNFLPQIPADFRRIRLGQGYDTKTGVVKTDAAAFRLNKLQKKKYILRGRGSLTQKVHVDCSSTDVANESFFKMGAEAKVNFWVGEAAVKSSMQMEKYSASTSSEHNIVVESFVKDESLEITGITSMTTDVYNCAFESFQLAYKNVMEAANVIQYMAAYDQFTSMYGDSYVTRLNLVAGSALKISMKKDSSAKSSAHKFTSGAGFSAPGVGASAAITWASSMQKNGFDGEMECEVYHEPHNSVTCKFVDDMFKQYSGESIAKLDNFEFPSEEDNPKLDEPEIPACDKDDEDEELPEPTLSVEDIREKIDSDETKEKNAEGKLEMSLEKYREEKNEKLRKLVMETTPAKVVEHARNMVGVFMSEVYETNKTDNNVPDIESNVAAKTPDEGIERMSNEKSEPIKDNEVDESGWDLKGYTPQSFETKPWTKICPNLIRTFPLTQRQIFTSRLWTFYLTRVEFLQYLQFLHNVHENTPTDTDSHYHPYPKNEDAKFDAAAYSIVCDKFLKKIVSETEKTSDITQEKYDSLIFHFNSLVLNLGGLWYSTKIYEIFFDKYEFFHDNPFGFAPILKLSQNMSNPGEMSSLSWRISTIKHEEMRLAPRNLGYEKGDNGGETEVQRVYPWIGKNGDFRFVQINRRGIVGGMIFWTSLNSNIDKVKESIHVRLYGPNGNPYIQEMFLQGIGFEHSELLRITKDRFRGAPILSKLPFEMVILPLTAGMSETESMTRAHITPSKCMCAVS